jgi:hypothetical protein
MPPRNDRNPTDAPTPTPNPEGDRDPAPRDEPAPASRFISLTTEHGTQIWIQRSAVVSVRAIDMAEYKRIFGKDRTGPLSIVETAAESWTVVHEAQVLIEALEA